MGKLIITEQERQDVLSKYNDENTSKEVLIYLRRHFVTYTYPTIPEQVMISINDKLYPVHNNKKFVKNRIDINLYSLSVFFALFNEFF